jgi:hypothetical protein
MSFLLLIGWVVTIAVSYCVANIVLKKINLF